jgi:TolB-like protein
LAIAPSSGPHVLRFGAFEVDLHSGELRKNGTRVRLSEQPFQLLTILLEHPGEMVTREDLQKRLWAGGTFVDFEQGLNAVVKRLREALEDPAESPGLIETVPRRGYRFIGTVAVSSRRIESLAVLPLENLSRDPEQEYFADGLTEALITTLAKIGALRVVSRTTVMRYKDVHRSLREIARDLEVDAIVEGTVQRSGERVCISAQLIQASTDTHLWAQSYARDLRDVLALQSEVARAVANEIQVKLTPQEQNQLAQSRQVDPQAYEHYLKGRYQWNKRTAEGMGKGMEHFQQAIERDPLYAAAYAGLADSASRLGFWGHVSPEAGCARAKAAASRAVELDNGLANAHAALGFSLLHYDYSFLSAEEECRRAIDLDPRSDIAAQSLSCCLMTMVRLEEGIFQAKRAAQLDPLSIGLQWTVGAMLYHARHYDQAITWARKCLEVDPSFPAPRWTIALSSVQMGTHESDISELEKVVQTTGVNQFFAGALGHCYAMTGKKEDALKVLGRMRDASKQRYLSAYWPAVIYGSIGENDEAFRLLETAYQEHSPWMPYVKVAPFFDSLRSDPRFDGLLSRMSFPP